MVDDVIAITINANRDIITDAAIAVEGNRILEVGKSADICARYAGAEFMRGSGLVAIPGLIDTHAHPDQSIFRGVADDRHWISFLAGLIEPNLRSRDPREAVTAYRLATYEMLRGGTTCFVSPNVDPRDDLHSLVETSNQIGIRAVLGYWTAPPRPGRDNARESRRVVDRATDRIDELSTAAGGLVRGWFGLMVPREPGDDEFPQFYAAVASAAEHVGAGIVYHFASEREDIDFYLTSYGIRPAYWAERNGLLTDRTILINAGHMSPDELAVVAANGAHIAHSPTATMKMSSGLLQIASARAANVNVSLGTDGAANNNSFDLYGEMKTACLLANALGGKPGSMTAEEALEMATLRGAKAIGREAELGSLEPGKLADIVLVDVGRPHIQPVHNVVSSLVYAARSSDVRTVIVDGVPRVVDGVVLGMPSTDKLFEEVAASARHAIERLHYAVPARWPVW